MELWPKQNYIHVHFLWGCDNLKIGKIFIWSHLCLRRYCSTFKLVVKIIHVGVVSEVISVTLTTSETTLTTSETSLVPRPPLAAFFAAVEKNVFFSTAAKKAARGGLGTRLLRDYTYYHHIEYMLIPRL